jgi:cytoskeletal protein RodZ
METSNFGNLLREARERRCISLADIAKQTKLSQSSLKMLEAGRLDDLPPEIFVRGFIRSYARSVGIRDAEPLGMFEQQLDARRRAEEALLNTPTVQPANDTVGVPAAEEDSPRRGIGLAVFVIIVLLIATITLSLFLRQPPRSGEGLSLNGGPAPRASALWLSAPSSDRSPEA